MVKHPTKLLILACLIVSIASVVFVLRSRDLTYKESSVPKNDSYTPQIAKANPPNEAEVGSPDGKWTLKMKEEKGKGEATYIFWIINLADGSQNEIFRKTISLGTTMVIPANTFSPDDKYVFLKEVDSGGIKYLALSATGGLVAKDTQTFEIASLFAEKHPDYKITDVTGWGGVNLLVINTSKDGGGQGPSFWFDMGSQSFIQLSNRFN